MFLIEVKINIAFDPAKFKTEPNNCVSYNLVFPDCEATSDLSKVSNEVLYNAGKSVQAIFNVFERELLARKAPCQLRTRKDRRA